MFQLHAIFILVAFRSFLIGKLKENKNVDENRARKHSNFSHLCTGRNEMPGHTTIRLFSHLMDAETLFSRYQLNYQEGLRALQIIALGKKVISVRNTICSACDAPRDNNHKTFSRKWILTDFARCNNVIPFKCKMHIKHSTKGNIIAIQYSKKIKLLSELRAKISGDILHWK